jgi:hypothetical protein
MHAVSSQDDQPRRPAPPPSRDPSPRDSRDPQTARTQTARAPAGSAPPAPEVGGRGGLDPTRYGDWEVRGRCVDF